MARAWGPGVIMVDSVSNIDARCAPCPVCTAPAYCDSHVRANDHGVAEFTWSVYCSASACGLTLPGRFLSPEAAASAWNARAAPVPYNRLSPGQAEVLAVLAGCAGAVSAAACAVLRDGVRGGGISVLEASLAELNGAVVLACARGSVLSHERVYVDADVILTRMAPRFHHIHRNPDGGANG